MGVLCGAPFSMVIAFSAGQYCKYLQLILTLKHQQTLAVLTLTDPQTWA